MIGHLRKRPLMFGIQPLFADYSAFLHGYQYGGEGAWMRDFRWWLVEELGEDGNIDWPYHVLRLAFPENSSLWAPHAVRSDAEDAAACALLFDRLARFDAEVPEGPDHRFVLVGAGDFQVLARLVGEFGELSDRSLEEVGAAASDIDEFRSAVRSLPAESAVGLRTVGFGANVRLDIEQLVFPPGRFELFRALIDQVVAAHGERELFLRTGFYSPEIDAAVAVLGSGESL
jgi:hypothetical protein